MNSIYSLNFELTRDSQYTLNSKMPGRLHVIVHLRYVALHSGLSEKSHRPVCMYAVAGISGRARYLAENFHIALGGLTESGGS